MRTTRAHFAARGRPVAYYSDRYGVFRVNRRDREGGPTQFVRALHTLDVESIHAGSPQAKGRVERANRTLQDRLVKEMRLHVDRTKEEQRTCQDGGAPEAAPKGAFLLCSYINQTPLVIGLVLV